MKTIDFDFLLQNFDGQPIADPACNWVKLILGAQASNKESDFLKLFSMVQQLNSTKTIQLDEADEQVLKKAIEGFNLIDPYGAPRVNAFMKAQLTMAINKEAK
jgi:hypothetical protein